MKHKKIRIALLFGGKSAEHEVSIASAKNVFNSLDKNKYDVTLIGIDKKGEWHKMPEQYLLESSTQSQIPASNQQHSLISKEESHLTSISNANDLRHFDVVFPILHGPLGEDGSMQGLLKLTNIPFVGAGVLGSAIGMDKDVMKRLLREAGLPVAKFLVIRKEEKLNFKNISQELGLPLFVKPANLGSSVGVSKVRTESEFEKAIAEAFAYDTKILIEEFIECREIECSVLGNDEPIASMPGEIIAHHEFYDYDAKYLDEKGAELKIPADLSKEKIAEVQELAVRGFKTLCLEGMARMDFFIATDGKLYINEANTIPGFTNISMYPKLWEASGMAYPELVDRLIQLAIERYEKEQKLKTSL